MRRAVSSCSIQPLSDVNCTGSSNECWFIMKLKDEVGKEGPRKAKQLYVCPCDPNLKGALGFVCKDGVIGGTYDFLILINFNPKNNKAGMCYHVEVKYAKKLAKIVSSLVSKADEQLTLGVNCVNLCDIECGMEEKIFVSNHTLPKYKRPLKIQWMTPHEFVESIKVRIN